MFVGVLVWICGFSFLFVCKLLWTVLASSHRITILKRKQNFIISCLSQPFDFPSSVTLTLYHGARHLDQETDSMGLEGKCWITQSNHLLLDWHVVYTSVFFNASFLKWRSKESGFFTSRLPFVIDSKQQQKKRFRFINWFVTAVPAIYDSVSMAECDVLFYWFNILFLEDC